MGITNYRERKPGECDVEVQFIYENQTVTGFIDARRQNDEVWEAWVGFSYARHDGSRGFRRDWIPIEQLSVVSVHDRPVTEQPTPTPPDVPREPPVEHPDAGETPE